MLITRPDLSRRKFGFTWWRMLVWLVLLFAAYSGVQFINLIQQTWAVMQATPALDGQQTASLHVALAWYIGSLLACFLVLVSCAGCILRQAWARPVLRVLSLILCVWSICRGVLSWQQWNVLGQAGEVLGANPQLIGLRRILLITLVLWGAAVPILAWLAWQLGQPAVRLQFRARRG